MNQKKFLGFFKEVTPAIVGAYIIWLGLSPAAAMALAMFMPEFSEPEKILLAMSFPFVFPLSLSQITFIDYENEMPLNNGKALKLFFLPVLIVSAQSLLLDFSFLLGIIMVVLSNLSSRLLAHIAASAHPMLFSEKRNFTDKVSTLIFYLLMTIPVYVFGQKIASSYLENYETKISIFMILIFCLMILEGAQVMYNAFRNDFEK